MDRTTGDGAPLKHDNAAEAPRSFDRSLPMLLMRAREAVLQRFRPHLRRHDITEQQWRVLRVLAEQERVEMLELAQRCNIQPPSLSRTIPLLARRGFVRRGYGSEDQRRVVVRLTPKGQELIRVMQAESERVNARLQAEIGAGRQADLYQLLEELIAIAGGKTPED
jgi:homoprotocatechuate degradation regulator HpaR